jgi:hypothetical protein
MPIFLSYHVPVRARRRRLRDGYRVSLWVACAYCRKLSGPYFDARALDTAARRMSEEFCGERW